MGNNKDNKKRNKKLLIILIILFLIGICSFLLISIKVSFTSQVVYNEREPYIDEHCKNIKLKSIIEWGVSDSVCVNQICDKTESYCVEKNFWGNCIEFRDRCIHYACTKYRMDCNINIDNIDDEGGTWNFKCYSINYETGIKNYIDDISVYVKPTRTAIGSWSFKYDAGESVGCKYELLDYPTKEVCENVIVYKNVEKTGEETRYCNLWKKIVGKC